MIRFVNITGCLLWTLVACQTENKVRRLVSEIDTGSSASEKSTGPGDSPWAVRFGTRFSQFRWTLGLCQEIAPCTTSASLSEDSE